MTITDFSPSSDMQHFIGEMGKGSVVSAVGALPPGPGNSSKPFAASERLLIQKKKNLLRGCDDTHEAQKGRRSSARGDEEHFNTRHFSFHPYF